MYLLVYQGRQFLLTDYEFRRLAAWYSVGFRPLREYYQWADRIRRRVAPDLPLRTFAAWIAAAFEFGYWEYVPPKRMVRIQTAVLYYARVTRKTPEPFMEARAWIIIPEPTDEQIRYWTKRTSTEAWYIPTLFASIYDAWEQGSITMVRQGIEVREVQEPEQGLQRAVAFYKEGVDIWDEPAYKYGERAIRTLESILFPCIRMMGFTPIEFKRLVEELHKSAAESLENYDVEGALDYIREIEYYMAGCGVLRTPLIFERE